jgi:hypothetical protein
MALLAIDATAEVLGGLREVEGLDLGRSVEELGAGRFRVYGYAAESLIPDLEARGCSVAVLMTSQAIDDFHEEVATTISPPPDDPTAVV